MHNAGCTIQDAACNHVSMGSNRSSAAMTITGVLILEYVEICCTDVCCNLLLEVCVFNKCFCCCYSLLWCSSRRGSSARSTSGKQYCSNADATMLVVGI